ncbi:uncharacterized protein GLRG_00645 [Colletotrichum graminicola M1.001]|uniref:Swi5-dependent recombination DNA repair protein 1 n=1 Tax=Colletotrichum graminicola (strain M1.001 / M2 / FGSC 10212) TaxID=645133 RepID=E3Q399_COLGM|nr:uncharacterized protein GLRG_00645 [Colletotrichum graminicola M1.001]EFQ25501.1 hypothetical protein GLRG_00645 [Colletotrichum graminicola M1.001]
MLTPAAKRRRVDTANETLRKPFKSPMVRGREGKIAGSAAAENPTASPPQLKPGEATHADPDSGAGPGSRDTTPTAATVRQRGAGTQVTTPARQAATPTRRPFSTPRPQLHPEASPSISRSSLHWTANSVTKAGDSAPGSKTTREAEGREEILRQARRIRGGGEGETDEELVELIGKWRAASRMAAEEVFEASRGRVEGMGGLRAWRRAQREDEARFAERLREGNGEELSPGHIEDGDGRKVCEDGEEEFTMGTMLRSMGINFDIIGFLDDDTGWRDG